MTKEEICDICGCTRAEHDPYDSRYNGKGCTGSYCKIPMTKEEFNNLSAKKDKFVDHNDKKNYLYWEKDVKTFIKLTEKDMRNPKLSRMGMVERFTQRAGKDLIDTLETSRCELTTGEDKESEESLNATSGSDDVCECGHYNYDHSEGKWDGTTYCLNAACSCKKFTPKSKEDLR